MYEHVLTPKIAQFPKADVKKYQAQIKEIDAKRVDGNFVTADGTVIAGSDEVSALLDRCLKWSKIVLER